MTKKINVENRLHICKIDADKLVSSGSYQSEIRAEYKKRTSKDLEIESLYGELWLHEVDDLKSASGDDFQDMYGDDFVNTFNEINPDDIKDKESMFNLSNIDLYYIEGVGAVLKYS